jgi:hypothetical protein
MTHAEQIQRSKQRHAKPKTETWAGPSWVTDLTGWRKEKLRQAREQGLIIYRAAGTGYEYLLESIPVLFLKNQKQQSL